MTVSEGGPEDAQAAARGANEETAGSPRGVRRRTALGRAVADRVRRLQKLSNQDVPSAVRTMAVLRRAASSEPAAVPDVWSDTIGLVPEEIIGRQRQDDPGPEELAAHHAVTLFATHRQGRVAEAHRDGVGPGHAFARLARKRGEADGQDQGVRRRFDAMITAATAAESAGHLRGLVQLLRAEDLPLDYGLLAEDLAQLWTPGAGDRARLRWARQYSGLSASSYASETAGAGHQASETNPTSPSSEERA